MKGMDRKRESEKSVLSAWLDNDNDDDNDTEYGIYVYSLVYQCFIIPFIPMNIGSTSNFQWSNKNSELILLLGIS